jgi:hypothetical protein
MERDPHGRPLAAAFCIAIAAWAARPGASSVTADASSPNSAWTPVWLSASSRPPKLCTFSTSMARTRL